MEQSVEEFGTLFSHFLREVVERAPQTESPLSQRLRAHLRADPLDAPVTSARLAAFEHPDLQLAIDAYVSVEGRSHEVIGLPQAQGMSVADALLHARGRIGAPGYMERPSDVGRQLACLSNGVVLVADSDGPPHALVVSIDDRGPVESLSLGVLAGHRDVGRRILDEVRSLMAEHSVYRGKVFTLSTHGPYRGRFAGAEFLSRPQIDRDSIVLADGTLERVERRTVRFDDVADGLAAQGLSRKRGLLLYGPPGTGKTLTVQYLISQMTGRTVVVLTGEGLGAIGPAATLARRLEPAMLVLEDVDLVAQDRTLHPTGNPVLFELLNALDGLGEDHHDIVVLLTTNRADLLEPALAGRPGRVDLAVELALPAAAERARLLALYTANVPNEVQDWSAAVERTHGTPASFINELVRTAALLAAERRATRMTAGDVDAALDELLDSGPLTAALLGARWDPERAIAGPGPSGHR